MIISAKVNSSLNQHTVSVKTGDSEKELAVPLKSTGFGSGINGGEFLALALATCYCNDIYREAAKRNLKINNVEVEARSEFGKDGEPGFNFNYTVKIEGDASLEVLNDLIKHTDTMAEIQNTLRQGVEVKLVS